MKSRTWDNKTKAIIVMEGLSGRPVPDICKQYQISEAVYALWKDQFAAGAFKAFPEPGSEKANSTPSVPLVLFCSGAVLLLLAVSASALLTVKHIWAISLVGCGQGGGCDWILKSPWGRIAGWPIAYLGLAFFATMLTLWLAAAREGITNVQVYLGRAGALISVGFIVVMIIEQHFCVWCLSAHLANLTWWGILEYVNLKRHSRNASMQAVVTSLLVFAVVAISAQALDYRERVRAQAVAHEAAIQSLTEMKQSEPNLADRVDSAAPTEVASTPAQTPPSKPVNTRLTTRRFGGRYWTGNKDAPVRIVVLQDYQCELCKKVESTLKDLLASRRDIALSVKQFPFDKTCNRLMGTENPHPGACVAARCAEAAGQVGGESAFWTMHYWLVERNGEVTLDEAANQFAAMGFDPKRFRESFNDPKIDSLISADIEDGIKYGLKYTPMVFVNGYEVRGWQSAGALPAAINLAAQLASQKPRPGDEPDPALISHYQQWLEQPMSHVQIRQDDHIRGPLSAPVSILVFGDISEQYNAKADKAIRELIQDTMQINYIFRAFPLQAECNDMVKRPINPHACEAAKAIEAAYNLGGAPAFWKLRAWIIAQGDQFLPALYSAGAHASGLEAEALKGAMTDPQIAERLARNVEMAKQLGVNASPTIFINGRRVADWQTPGLLSKIVESLLSTEARR